MRFFLSSSGIISLVICFLAMIIKSSALVNRALLRRAISLNSRRLIHASAVSTQLSETPSDALVEGAYVQLKTGEKGYLAEKTGGGWWRVSLEASATKVEEIVKIRTSAFQVILDDKSKEEKQIITDKLLSVKSATKVRTKIRTKTVSDEIIIESKTINKNLEDDNEVINFELKTIEAPILHQKTQKWIIFSDLHVKSASIETCETVLRKVHEAALERNAGIIFLGDFWHVRGALCVDLLNRVLSSLKLWTQPVIMIPGNHDQVTLSGGIHALQPLQYVFSPGQILLISEPTVCMGALWIPYRRNPKMMKAILSSGTFKNNENKNINGNMKNEDIILSNRIKNEISNLNLNSNSNSNTNSNQLIENKKVSIIFCHADIQGASMNDNMRCKEGLDISAFPPNLPIYSGHFHKPHTMTRGKSSLRYVGSPYQTSLSEAGQEKYLYCMNSKTGLQSSNDTNSNSNNDNSNNNNSNGKNVSDSNCYNWREEDRWPLDVGRKYFRALSVTDPIIQQARPGDRLVIPICTGEDVVADTLMRALKAKGVEVELRPERKTQAMMNGFNLLNVEKNFVRVDERDKNSVENVNILVNNDEIDNNNDILDISKVDPIFIFNQYMKSTAGSLLFEDLNTMNSKNNEKNIKSKKKIDISNKLTTMEDNLIISSNEIKNENHQEDENKILHESVLTEGKKTLNRILNTNDITGKDSVISESRANANQIFDLTLQSVSLLNFGPYGGDRVFYPLEKRGLVLIRGQSSDGTGADSNGSGKTTLAMSVMWGLTGNMDPRLVSDGKALDVAYDAGEGNPKRVAEVTLTGIVNGEDFKIVRKRGAKKAELFFSIGGKDLTTQAVKDTQNVIEAKLGIGGGLLQRCCFFGQHSHTLHSLLGLTDIKLKNELSTMVDTSTWINALQDVKNRIKNDKNRITEISVEIRIRDEEIGRSKLSINNENENLKQLESELETAKSKVYAEMGRSSDHLNQKFHGENLTILMNRLNVTIKNNELIKIEKIEPLRKILFESARNIGLKTIDLDRNITNSKEKYNLSKAALNSNIDIKKNLLQKLSIINQHMSTTSSNFSSIITSVYHELYIQHISSNNNEKISNNNLPQNIICIEKGDPVICSDPFGNLLDVSNVQYLQILQENSLSDLATMSVSVTTNEKALENLLSLNSDVYSISTSTEKIINNVRDANNENYDENKNENKNENGSDRRSKSCVTHSVEQCPTCGQELSSNQLIEREIELKKVLQSLQIELKLLQIKNSDIKRRYDLSTRAKLMYEQWYGLQDRKKELLIDINNSDNLIVNMKNDEIKYENELNVFLTEKVRIEDENKVTENLQTAQMEEAENNLKNSTLLEIKLRNDVEEFRSLEASALSTQGKVNATVVLLDDRLNAIRNILVEKTVALASLEKVVNLAGEERGLLIENGVVLDRLEEIFGPRGIQHYVFMTVIKQLEEISNAYLMVLAEGGIQLVLEGDELEKIVKSVIVRSADGKYRERGLSQLSGGQWRRVSMALDLAFAEIIRRKGALRCNLIVMDEVLTHLDSAGREAVGSVLRSMVATEDGRRGRGVKDSEVNGLGVDILDGEDLLMDDEISVEGVLGGSGRVGSSKNKAEALERRRALIGGGAYETVLVILQDLAATELEEAFDHIDVVVKKADTTKVIIDGI